MVTTYFGQDRSSSGSTEDQKNKNTKKYNYCFLVFTFLIQFIIIQFWQFEPTNALNLIEITIILEHTSSYFFLD